MNLSHFGINYLPKRGEKQKLKNRHYSSNMAADQVLSNNKFKV